MKDLQLLRDAISKISSLWERGYAHHKISVLHIQAAHLMECEVKTAGIEQEYLRKYLIRKNHDYHLPVAFHAGRNEIALVDGKALHVLEPSSELAKGLIALLNKKK